MRTLIILLLITGCVESENPKTDTGPAGEDTDGNVDPFLDADGDGFIDDCDDTNPDVFPGAIEICDGLDNDCNNAVDDNAVDAATWYLDDDGDGYGDAAEETASCDAVIGHVANSDDCDDQDARFNPGAIESDCEDQNDYNCDGSVGWADADNDGFAACADCDDSDSAINDDALEICNGVDDNCDGHTDEDDADLSDGTLFYGDSDGDGYGGQQYEAIGCVAPAGFVDNNDDCDDLNSDTYPSASEVCDEQDNDCDGDIDEGVEHTWYADADGDGYGDATSTSDACNLPPGYTSNGDDCNDTDPTAHPGSFEVCDSVDNDCDGTVDEDDAINASAWYADTDGDGFGDATSITTSCSLPSGHVSNNTDCDDLDASNYPGGTEVCDEADNDCDGATDEGVLSTFYVDSDGDSYGDSGTTVLACTLPTGASANALDCDDALPLVNPAAAELCDAIDNNCTGGIDEGFDSDSDGVSACGPDGVFGNGDDDCDDSKASVSPGAVEVCDGQFNDCQASAYDSSSAPVDELDGDSDYYVACVGYDSATWVGDALVVGGDDCDGADGSIHPGAAEVCDSIDSDCDLSLVDEFLNTDSDTLPDCVDPDDDNDGTLDVDDCAPLDPTDNTTVGNVSGSQVFSYTGGSQTLVVPECVLTMTLEMWGAQGSNGNGSERGTGGQGGYATGDLSVQSGEVLTITVGGQAGYNGGGSGGFGNSNGGQGGNAGVGGGASTVHRDGSLLVVAGGGGGGGNSYFNGNHCCDGSTPEDGGAGGGLNGNDGQNDTSGNAAGVGGGGTQSSGGSGGAGINSGGSGTGGSQASGGTGGNGFYNCAGGGGGGGYYGGGGGGAPSQGSGGSGGGGGGGSSWLGTLSTSSTSVGGNSGDGEVTISWGN